ncbi:MAG: hypothetical protein J2P17_00875 [Mycobacterium sp.]|nr:hypothetical protein [Mycobacterium sp.]
MPASPRTQVGTSDDYPSLFSPFTIGPMRLKNRIVFPAMQMGFAQDHHPSERFMRSYTQLAQGGAGMIVLEASAVHPTSGPRRTMTVAYRPQDRPAFEELARTAAQYDCRLVAQLHHTGSSRVVADGRLERIAPSAVPDFYNGELPRTMTGTEIDEIVTSFVTAARVFADCGLAGIELHAAHGHLLCRFLSPYWNHRTDGYGGSLTARTRIVRDIVTGVRTACGPGFVIGLRMPGDEGIPEGIGSHLAAELLTDIHADAPIDYVSFGQGTVAPSFGDHVPDMHYPPAPFLELTRRLRDRSPVPVVTAGRIGTPAQAEHALASGAGDLVAMGRALLADPDLPHKAAAGVEVRRCIYCNLCWGKVQAGAAGECTVNPWWGRPSFPIASAARRVTVVGGGVAGLEAAAGAAERGHHVMLLHGPRLGGSLVDEARLPGRAELGLLVNTLDRRARAAGVSFRRLSHPADANSVLATGPDVIVVATGSIMPKPAVFEGDSTSRDIGIRQLIHGRHRVGAPSQGTLVVIDNFHDHAVYAAAEFLVPHYRRIVLLCAREEIGELIPWTNRLGVQHRMASAAIECVPGAEPVSRSGKTLQYRHRDSVANLQDVDRIVWATERVPNTTLAAPLGDPGIPVITVGDAHRPSTLLAALEQTRAAIGRLDSCLLPQ